MQDTTTYQGEFAPHSVFPRVKFGPDALDNVTRMHQLVHGPNAKRGNYVSTTQATFVLPEVMRSK